MSKNKLKKFAETKEFYNVIQPKIKGLLKNDHKLKGNWNKLFKNNNPIIIELGCGKGEYTVGLAQNNKNFNFIGIDIKGARIWRGAKTAIEKILKNVLFLRTKIDFIDKFFEKNEISEIWIPHPDPQPKKPRKRLTSDFFLTLYQKITIDNAKIHLKTDNSELFYFTLNLVEKNNFKIIEKHENIHKKNLKNPISEIKTFYEKKFLHKGAKISYLCFRLDNNKKIQKPVKKTSTNYKY